MKKILFFQIVFSILFGHDPERESINWKKYYRIGGVQSKLFDFGLTGYGRIKRTTLTTFKDLRFYANAYNKKTEIRIRYKSSRRLIKFNNFYSFSTIVYEKNTSQNMNLRYHYSQGVGWFLQNKDNRNMTIEVGPAFDNSDYLNSEVKTSYLKSGYSIDFLIRSFKSRFELDYFYQISNNIKNQSRSRIQTLGEIEFYVTKFSDLTLGFIQDYKNKKIINNSFWVTASISKPLKWQF